MTRVPFVDAEAVRELLPHAEAIDALARAFAVGDPSATPRRTSVETPSGILLAMPAANADAVGVKLVTLTPDNPPRGLSLIHAVYVLFDGRTQAPLAVIDGGALTALRTSAVTALATRALARTDAARLVVFGSGVQASAHIDAIRAVRPIERVTIVGRDADRAAALAARTRDRGVDAAGVGDADAVREADIVCTCTTSTEPLFDGAALPEGCHVNAVGAFRPTEREVDTETVRRARVVVETREAAAEEAGDLLVPIAEGAIGWDRVAADLAELVAGARVRRTDDDVTLFVSVGLAFEDLAIATEILSRGD